MRVKTEAGHAKRSRTDKAEPRARCKADSRIVRRQIDRALAVDDRESEPARCSDAEEHTEEWGPIVRRPR